MHKKKKSNNSKKISKFNQKETTKNHQSFKNNKNH